MATIVERTDSSAGVAAAIVALVIVLGVGGVWLAYHNGGFNRQTTESSETRTVNSMTPTDTSSQNQNSTPTDNGTSSSTSSTTAPSDNSAPPDNSGSSSTSTTTQSTTTAPANQ